MSAPNKHENVRVAARSQPRELIRAVGPSVAEFATADLYGERDVVYQKSTRTEQRISLSPKCVSIWRAKANARRIANSRLGAHTRQDNKHHKLADVRAGRTTEASSKQLLGDLSVNQASGLNCDRKTIKRVLE